MNAQIIKNDSLRLWADLSTSALLITFWSESLKSNVPSLWVSAFFCWPLPCEAQIWPLTASIPFLHLKPVIYLFIFFTYWTFQRSISRSPHCAHIWSKVTEISLVCFDDTHFKTFLNTSVCPNGITRFAVSIYLPAFLSTTWEAQTQAPTTIRTGMIITSALREKAGMGNRLAFILLLVYWSRQRKKEKKKYDWHRGYGQLKAIWSCNCFTLQ